MSIIKSLGERTTQRVRVACRYDADQTCKSQQGRKIGAAGAIGAHERKSACECLALYDGEAFLTGSKRKHVGRFIESLKLPLGNRLVVNEPRVIRKWSVNQSSHMDQSNAIHRLDCLSKDIHTLPI